MVRLSCIGLLLASASACSSASTHSTAPTAPAPPLPCANVTAEGPTYTTYYGIVVDQLGRTIAGATIVAASFTGIGGPVRWQRQPDDWKTTSDRDGRYRLVVPLGNHRLEVTADGRTSVWVGVHTAAMTSNLDLEIDRSKPEGTITVTDWTSHDHHSRASACAWTCPSSPPPQEWWLRDPPCPSGAALSTAIAPRDPSVVIACKRADGVAHGASSVWGLDVAGIWTEHAAWYQDGTPCPATRPAAEVAP